MSRKTLIFASLTKMTPQTQTSAFHRHASYAARFKRELRGFHWFGRLFGQPSGLVATFTFILLSTSSPVSTYAGYMLSISSATDVSNLTAGQVVEFDVLLSGVDPANTGTYVSYLAATVNYDNTLLSASPAVTAGSIVTDPVDFVGTSFPNAADAFYDSVYGLDTTAPITQSGVFFTFAVTVDQAGSGTLSFSADSATLASDPDQNDQFSPDTASLDFHIAAPATAPEPSTFTIVMGGLLSGALFRRMRKRRQTKPG